jgi:hypothetical protein
MVAYALVGEHCWIGFSRNSRVLQHLDKLRQQKGPLKDQGT